MAAPEISVSAPPPSRPDFERWRRRSRLIRRLRIVLPALIAVIFLWLASAVIYSTFQAQPRQAQGQDEPIQMVNFRAVGRDDRGRTFVITAESAIRDLDDYQRVVLQKPSLVLDEGGPDEMRVRGATGIFREADHKLDLTEGVRLADAKSAFDTAASVFDTRTGELIGSGPIRGSGPLGEIDAESYAVYDKGDRMVFKGGVRARIDPGN